MTAADPESGRTHLRTASRFSRAAQQPRAPDPESTREDATDQPLRESREYAGKSLHALETAAAPDCLDRGHRNCGPAASGSGHGVGMRGMSGCLLSDARTRTRRLHPVQLLREPPPGLHWRARQVVQRSGSGSLPEEHGASGCTRLVVLKQGRWFTDGAGLANVPAARGRTRRNMP